MKAYLQTPLENIQSFRIGGRAETVARYQTHNGSNWQINNYIWESILKNLLNTIPCFPSEI